jgi:hypothetical protein
MSACVEANELERQKFHNKDVQLWPGHFLAEWWALVNMVI